MATKQLTQSRLIKALAEMLAKKAIIDATHFYEQDADDEFDSRSMKQYLLDFGDENMYVIIDDFGLKLDQAVQAAYKRQVRAVCKKV